MTAPTGRPTFWRGIIAPANCAETVAELRRRANGALDESQRARCVLAMMGDHLAVERQSLDEYAGGRERRADALRAAADSLERQATRL